MWFLHDFFIQRDSGKIERVYAFYLYTVYKKIWKHASIYSGGRLNKKDGLTRYGDSHVKDKTS